MKKNLLYAAAALAAIIVCFGFYFLGNKHGVESMSFKHVQASQLAAAMKGDHFYTDYRENTLIMVGQVLSVSQNSNVTQVAFATGSSEVTACALAKGVSVPTPGSVITILSEGAHASRLPNGVLLTGCIRV
ncbi:MAG TPA: hypothetical protein VLH84_01975 [Patescibacteria group bacterium]|nr:hypothetical protein [Patescibacteria group bacterium]